MAIPLTNLKPTYPPNPSQSQEPPQIQKTITALSLLPHPEGGYYAETDRDPRRVPNPFAPSNSQSDTRETRSASTSIFYLLTPNRPLGAFHRNKGRTVHVWQRGRGRYVVIHADEVETDSEGMNGKARVETFVVGPDVASGERMQWVVEGGKYKSSFLLGDEPSGESEEGLLISEVGSWMFIERMGIRFLDVRDG
jgi:predicted cupin superfamily sugar epimerase